MTAARRHELGLAVGVGASLLGAELGGGDVVVDGVGPVSAAALGEPLPVGAAWLGTAAGLAGAEADAEADADAVAVVAVTPSTRPASTRVARTLFCAAVTAATS
ncbi:MAG: hypothetical protein JWO27_669 [Frankiales bacterium]|nr:hypothetical protein [Frankiales bacterium]